MNAHTILTLIRSTKHYPRPEFVIPIPVQITLLSNPTNDIALNQTEQMTQVLFIRLPFYLILSTFFSKLFGIFLGI